MRIRPLTLAAMGLVLGAEAASATTLQCILHDGRTVLQTIDHTWHYDNDRLFRVEAGALITISRDDGSLTIVGTTTPTTGYCGQVQLNDDPDDPEPLPPTPSSDWYRLARQYPAAGAQPPPPTGPVPGQKAPWRFEGLVQQVPPTR